MQQQISDDAFFTIDVSTSSDDMRDIELAKLAETIDERMKSLDHANQVTRDVLDLEFTI